jgi:hypothetical protein
MFAVAAAFMLAGVMSASTVHAKACPALCTTQIHACKLLCTTKPKAKCKKACKKHFVGECKLTSSTPKDRTCPSSPSGAFID